MTALDLRRPAPTGVERLLGPEELIVSKTDLQGRLTYVNDVFLRISGYEEAELLGAPHSLVRHPDMPRAVFKLLWARIQAGREVFAFVVNMAKNGDHYWVLAHVTPSLDGGGRVVGYHSNRRSAARASIEQAQALYAPLLAAERAHPDRRRGLEASCAALKAALRSAGLGYDELVFTRLGAESA